MTDDVTGFVISMSSILMIHVLDVMAFSASRAYFDISDSSRLIGGLV